MKEQREMGRRLSAKRTAGRLLIFAATIGMLGLAAFFAVAYLRRSASGGDGGFSISLCGLSSPDRMVIGAYLDAHAADLERPAGTDDTPVTFVVQPGETAAEIAVRLQEQGLISDAELFRRYVQYHGLDAGIEAGEFTLRQTMTIPEIALALQRGTRPEQVVTIQEGLRLEQVAAVVAAQTSIPQEEFLTLATVGWRDAGFPFDFLGDIPPDATLEGHLFPDTYRLPEDATARDLLERMLATFDARVTAETRAAAANRGLNGYELIILASIVEREAVLDEERPLIASVYYNRLEAGWLLNADPTVQYVIGAQSATGDWWPVLTLDNLEVDSPYNTYRYTGLPPGPICSPGLSSIQAVAYPAETGYFFFLADCTANDGSHLFAATEEEHFDNYVLCGGVVP